MKGGAYALLLPKKNLFQKGSGEKAARMVGTEWLRKSLNQLGGKDARRAGDLGRARAQKCVWF